MEELNPVSSLENPKSRVHGTLDDIKTYIPPGTSFTAMNFHRQIPGYRISPLKGLNNLAAMLGLGGIWVKDEAQRLELNSFKVLGGSYAVYRCLKKRLGMDHLEISIDELNSHENKKKLGKIIFCAATDGNHGRGVAWAAGKLGYKSIIYVHETTAEARIRAIKNYGAEVKVIKGTYDDAVKQVKDDASRYGWQVISDTSWEDYEEIPAWVMQGYTTLFAEAQEQLAAQGIVKPTHVFIQAGVGALAASLIGFYRWLFRLEPPVIAVVEPAKAACIFHSYKIGDGKPHNFNGPLDTIMAGLACGEPNPIAWKILWKYADYFLTCQDFVAAKGMRVYGVPLRHDPFIISGESGAVTLGALMFIMQFPGLKPLMKNMGLGKESQILLINTEGNTDPVQFRRVVWEGLEPVPKKYRFI